jgi:Family of unknown function (DUF5681)
MSDKERRDIQTRFKKGQSGNPSGRPKGRKNKASQLRDVLFRNIVVKDSQGSRTIPKIVAAAEVCLNNAIKGDLRSFAKIMEIAQKLELVENFPTAAREITEIKETIVGPMLSETPLERDEYFARLARSSNPNNQ